MTYLALGDSYTIGEGVPPEDSWPLQLADRLTARGYEVRRPTVIAKTGWTADELRIAILDERLRGTFDLVSLLIGVNNQYRGRTTSDFVPDLASLLEMAIRFADNDQRKVFVLSIPDYGCSPFAADRDREEIARGIDSYNDMVRATCETRSVSLFDITPISRDVTKEDFAEDGLHPSRQQYTRWVDAILHGVINRMNIGGLV